MQAGAGFNPYQNPEMAQLAAILGTNSANNGNNGNMNGINAYLPYMMSQGASNPEIQKQIIQNMMMSQMMPGFGMSGF